MGGAGFCDGTRVLALRSQGKTPAASLLPSPARNLPKTTHLNVGIKGVGSKQREPALIALDLPWRRG